MGRDKNPVPARPFRLSRLRHGLILALGIPLFFISCSVDSAKSHYVLAEKLWTARKYSAAVSEFEKVISKDPKGELGLQAQYRAAMTQFLFLSQPSDAVRNFRSFIRDGHGDLVWDAQIQVGEILFAKTEQYDQAIAHYLALVKQKPNATEVPEFLFRIGKSQFFLFQFAESLTTYDELIKKYPTSVWAEKAAFEKGATTFTKEDYSGAIEIYENFIKLHPQSTLISEARFGVASCLEELGQLEEAYRAYAALKTQFPSPHVIEVKLARIKERMAQRNTHKP